MTAFSSKVIGILGGGQLGRMLVQKGMDWNLQLRVMDPDPEAPCKGICEFVRGNIRDFDEVVAFGKGCDILTIEIENVNTEALKWLEKEGKKVHPSPSVIELIQDKRTQKAFYEQHAIPTAPFVLTENRADVAKHAEFLPGVHKLGREGYDGRGVQVLRSENDLGKAFDAPGLLEKFVDFEKEISVIVARNERGDVVSYPTVEMIFHPEANLVEYLFALMPLPVATQADALARQVIEKLNMVGILAVEMFVTRAGEVAVARMLRACNQPGHQTIEANVTSQYEQHLRAIQNLPPGDTSMISPSAMINLLGAEGYAGPARYEGLKEVLNLRGVYVHLYGKKLTKPFRKMGHVTIVDHDMESLQKKATFVKRTLKIIA